MHINLHVPRNNLRIAVLHGILSIEQAPLLICRLFFDYLSPEQQLNDSFAVEKEKKTLACQGVQLDEIHLADFGQFQQLGFGFVGLRAEAAASK